MGKLIKLVYTEHSTHNRRRDKVWFEPIEYYIYSKYDRLISISQQTQDNLMEWLKAKKDDKRFLVIENGVNLSLFSSVIPIANKRKQIDQWPYQPSSDSQVSVWDHPPP